MAQTFRFPDVGEGISEGEVVRWLVTEGDAVRIDQPLAEIETDKAVVEMPSPFAGTVLKIHAGEKALIKVGAPLVTIGAPGEPVPEPAPPVGLGPSAGRAAAAPSPSAPSAGEILATPLVRKLARDLGVDLAAVRATGPQGRISEADVRSATTAQAVPPPAPAFKIKAKFDLFGELERIPLRGIRRATAKRMAQSVSTAAHVTHIDEAEATALIRLRESLRPAAEARGVKLTYLPLVVKAVIAALIRHPTLNAWLDDAEEEIVLKKYYNIGIAVDVPDGLIVPVVKFADLKPVLDIAAEIAGLAAAARARTLDLADLKGGSFSITNVGVLGGEAATPIINYPETAILATMRLGDRVRARAGRPEVVPTLPLCLSFDHRVIDGAEAARFMADLKANLEDDERLRAAVGTT
jgi:pyruvate dehydrogenase E2 component (dihydrolipoamide acetyltransferase)